MEGGAEMQLQQENHPTPEEVQEEMMEKEINYQLVKWKCQADQGVPGVPVLGQINHQINQKIKVGGLPQKQLKLEQQLEHLEIKEILQEVNK